jgi:hypothetical protein
LNALNGLQWKPIRRIPVYVAAVASVICDVKTAGVMFSPDAVHSNTVPGNGF